MRGKAKEENGYVDNDGITPAYAGKSEIDYGSELSNLGSPPPMRGKADILACVNGYFGITPAYAGKSFKRFFARSMYQDHPRLCGEKWRD